MTAGQSLSVSAITLTNGDNDLCPSSSTTGKSVTLNSGTSNTSITWKWYLDGAQITGASSSSLVANAPGTYKAEITDNNGCIASTTKDILQTVPNPTLSISGGGTNSVICSGQLTLTASPSTGYSYNWTSSAGGNISGATNAAAATVTSAGTYTAQLTTGTGSDVCTYST